jgi:hypothetical protein
MILNKGIDKNSNLVAKLTKFALIGIALFISGVLLVLVAWRVFSAGPAAQLNIDNFPLVMPPPGPMEKTLAQTLA